LNSVTKLFSIHSEKLYISILRLILGVGE